MKHSRIRYIWVLLAIVFVIAVIGLFLLQHKDKDTITVHIGYQSVTTQTWSALIIKNQGTFQEKLQQMYPDKKVIVEWHDEISGAIINNNMFAHKYQLGYMGDMPCIINAYNGSDSKEYNSTLVCLDGKGANGRNQSLMVSADSKFKSIEDLSGMTISVPIGSSTHRMVLKLLEKYELLDAVTVIHQDVTTATSMIEAGKIDAFAAWEPYPTMLVQSGKARILAGGQESETDYLAGIMADSDWAKDNREILVAFLECVIKAHDFMTNHKEDSADIVAKESGFSEDIILQLLDRVRWDSVIYKKDYNTLIGDYDFLNQIDKIKEFKFEDCIDESYLKEAVHNLNLKEYDKALLEWPDIVY